MIGLALQGSSLVPEGQVVRMGDRVLYHERVSVRARRRRPHGRTNGPRRWKARIVLYRPDYDRMMEATR